MQIRITISDWEKQTDITLSSYQEAIDYLEARDVAEIDDKWQKTFEKELKV